MTFKRVGEIHLAVNRRLAQLPFVGAMRQGDDLGFRTSTFLPPDDLREFVFPIYREMVKIAHAAGKPFVLHSCGNLDAVYEDLIDCGIDAKHSFEEAILPVQDFKKRYGKRMTPLGGLDVDMICRASGDDLRRYAREKIEGCFAEDGHWAMGTGNSLTDYMPVENYLAVLEEARNVAGHGR
jgi:uroporphyrinogen decarboxylase